jgi:uncharacterized membrane protein YdjX (TVP38/TMEM64 family)
VLKIHTTPTTNAIKPVVLKFAQPLAMLILLTAVLWGIQRLLPDASTLTHITGNWEVLHPVAFMVLFVMAGMLFISIGLPRQTLALIGGYTWGAVTGSCIALIAVMAGSALSYHLGASIGRQRLQQRYPQLVNTLDGWTTEHVIAKTLALRLFPVGSNLATNLAAGITHTRRLPFFSASLLGFIPQTVIFALTGSGVNASSLQQMLLALGLLLLSILAGLWFTNNVLSRRA